MTQQGDTDRSDTSTAAANGDPAGSRRHYTAGNDHHYKEPGWFTRHVFNAMTAGLTRLGVSVYGSRVLEVRGRRSGQVRSTPVNLVDHDGCSYLVAARGETEWVRNVRADEGRLRLVHGRKTEAFRATALAAGPEAAGVLRAYLRRWKFEVGVFFDGLSADSTDEELLAAVAKHPVFRLEPAAS